MIKPFSTLTMRRRSVLAAPALLLPEKAWAWSHGRAGSPPPPPPASNSIITETSDQITSETGDNLVTE